VGFADSEHHSPNPPLVRRRRHEQIREGCQYIHLAGVLEHPPKPGLLKAELTLDDSERMLTFRADVSLGGLDQIIEPTLRGIG
jgi:hypothetical protein